MTPLRGLRFNDKSWETAYRQVYASESVAHIRTVGIAVAVLSIFIGFSVADVQAGMTPLQMKMTCIAIAVVFAAMGAMGHLATFQRRSQQLTLAVAFLPAGVLMWIGLQTPASEIASMLATSDTAMMPNDARSAILGPFLLTVLFATATGARLRFAYVATFCVVLVAGAAAIAHKHPPSSTVQILLGTIFVVAIVLALFAAYQLELYTRRNFMQTALLEGARQQSEDLLLNILPAAIAERLKADKSSIADGFQDVTVLFADVAGFTTLSENLAPSEVVTLLNDIFTRFDRIAEAHGLEKIKTIGDAYMVAGGIPVKRDDHAAAVAAMALDMRNAIREIATPLGQALQMRIGINSGPVVAGVIGVKKFIYDLWGDTVNIASRMESHGTTGEIQVTEATYEKLKDQFRFSERGVIDIKGKGPMRVWYLRERLS